MTDRFDQLAKRKAALLDLTDAQRLELAVLYTSFERPARTVTRVGNFVRNPFVLAGMGLFAAKLPWRRVFKVSGWAWKGWKWFKLFKTVRRFV
jgi:hypothetical protein